MKQELLEKDILSLEKSYQSRSENAVAERAVTHNGISASAVDEKVRTSLKNTYSIDVDCGDITNQRQSGRCWMFAGLNVIRTILMKKLNIKNIELSQAYLQFYDKLEKANFFLEKAIELREEKSNSRMNLYVLDSIMGDGGHFAMFVNLVKKYGVVPSSEMPDYAVSKNTSEMNEILGTLLANDMRIIHEDAKKGVSEDKIRAKKSKMLDEIYRVLAISIGVPPKDFVFEYKDLGNADNKEKPSFKRLPRLTPKEFYDQYIGADLDEYMPLCDAPIEGMEMYQKYTCSFCNNVINGDPVIFFNIPLSEMKKAAIKSLKAGEVMWFAADVLAQSMRKEGYMSKDLIRVDELMNLRFPMSKGDRLTYRSSFCNHAMTFTGVNLDEKGKPNRWKVENSWGKENGIDGFYVMDDAWFDNYVYMIFVNKKYVKPEIVKKYEESTIIEEEPFNTLYLGMK